jgi:hypothetical protein
MPGMVALTCNPRGSGDGDQEDCGSRLAGQKVTDTPISTNKPDMVVHI